MENLYRHLIFGFHGLTVPQMLRKAIEKGLFGVVLFSRNYSNPQQFRSLIEELNSIAVKRPKNPLVIAIDHEGGRVQRLKEGFTRIPTMKEIGAQGANVAYETGRIIGRELKGVGINLNFAPVLDVDSNPENPIIGDRSFSSDPPKCAEMGVAFIRGIHSEGVNACGKHFPGHGDSSEDSHKTLPVIRAERETMMQRELVPFKRCIEEGLRLIMTSHCLYPMLDKEFPATLSEKVIKGLLRNYLGFKWLVITDDLQMSALRDNFTVEEITARAIMATVDILLICEMEKGGFDFTGALERLYREDTRFRELLRISEARIDLFTASFSP